MSFFCSYCFCAQTITLECEKFSDRGGWSVDSQFRREMGSSYLIAHGLGRPVADAKTVFKTASGGSFTVWARTKNWTAKWSDAAGAGRFAIVVNGKPLPVELGTEGNGDWVWSKAGEVLLKAGENEISLRDLTGFDGRCDAVCLNGGESPEETARASVTTKVKVVKSDLTVVGGGIAGICTAVSAARLGLKVALVQDRPVLGGANSSEVRVHLGGRINIGKYPRLGDVVAEIGPARGGNAMPAENYEDGRKLAVVNAERNISLFLSTSVDSVCTNGCGVIVSAKGCNVETGDEFIFKSPLFVDCTGDGTVGFLAGAKYRIGRESKAQTGESLAPEKADRMTMGSSVQWYATTGNAPTEFAKQPWMLEFGEKSCHFGLHGDWNWETGMNRDQLGDFETVRDYGLLVVYSNWAYVKSLSSKRKNFEKAKLEWVAYVAGKRETRRLMGDCVLTQQDVCSGKEFPDGTCMTTWTIDLHYPVLPEKTGFKGEPFRSYANFLVHEGCLIPYRCFYSCNVPNLFMAGRNISVTHVALGTTRVMRTHGMMGEVVGMASSICRKYGCSPREVYSGHLDELKALMEKGVGTGKTQPPQNYNLGTMRFKEPKK